MTALIFYNSTDMNLYENNKLFRYYPRRQDHPIFPRLSWQYHNYTSMTTFLRHVSTIYSNLTALYSIGQSVQVC